VSRAAITEQSAGLFQLSGVLDFLSGPLLRKQGGQLIAASQAASCVIDCAGVDKSSSVGLSLLLAFMRDAQAAGKSLVVRSMPADMREIASVSGLLDVLPLEP
jgi:phospholipid transport system transporter-binding protein